jgi:arylsulfatase A-like enzyme
VTQTVRSVDVMPTILDLLGVQHPAGDGRSLVPLVRGREVDDRVALSHNLRFGPERLALRTGEFKLIRNLSPDPSSPPVDANAPAIELYDLHRDPGERSNVAPANLGEVERLQRALDASFERTRKLGAANFGPRPDRAPELERQLEALGYGR